jgi:hypothetical protein
MLMSMLMSMLGGHQHMHRMLRPCPAQQHHSPLQLVALVLPGAVVDDPAGQAVHLRSVAPLAAVLK